MAGGGSLCRVATAELITWVVDFEAAVFVRGQFEIKTGIRLVDVCDVRIGGVVLFSAFFREVKLPKSLESIRRPNRID